MTFLLPMIQRWFKSKQASPSAEVAAGSNSDRYASPASTSLDELVNMRAQATALRRATRKRSAAPASGPAMSRRLGRGLDFAEVREYQAGDDVRMIDWKVTARTGKTHTKLFVEERERPVMLVVDFRSHMRFGTQGMFKSVMAARLSALIGWTANNNQDRVGGFVFTDDWHTEIRPRSGRRGLMNFFRGIAQAQMHAPSGDQGQLADTLSRLRTAVHAGSTVVIFSDFIGFDEQAQLAMGNLLQRLDILAVHIVDPIEGQLPDAGRYSLSGMHSQAGNSLAIDTGSKTQTQRYLEGQIKHQQAVADFFSSHGHVYIRALTSQPLLDIAARILSRKADKVSGKLSNEVSGQVSDKLSETVPGNLPGNVSGNVSGNSAHSGSS